MKILQFFMDLRASNHMNSHVEWFRELRKLEKPGYVKIEDDATNANENIGDVPFDENGCRRDI